MPSVDVRAGAVEPVAELPPLRRVNIQASEILRGEPSDLAGPLEGRLLYYARHLLATDRWTDLADYFDAAHDGGNSHHQALPPYRRMLEAYEPLFKARTSGRGLGPDHFLFSADELDAIAGAAVHPENRRADGRRELHGHVQVPGQPDLNGKGDSGKAEQRLAGRDRA